MMSDRPEGAIELTIPGKLEYLDLVDNVVEAVNDLMHFGEDEKTAVSISVVEAGTNAIQHGHHRDASKPVDIEFHMRPDVLEIVVHDTGPGFDLKSINGNVTSPERLLEVRGRGIYIMRECMDTVEFEFSSRGTTCRLVKKRPPAARAD